MSINFTVFSVDSGALKSSSPLPDYFHRLALHAYRVIRNDGQEVEQSRIEELATACLQMLGLDEAQYLTPWTVQREIACLAEDSRIVGEVACLLPEIGRYDHDTKRYLWADAVADGDTLLPSQMVAAFAFHKIDVAASAYLAGESELALQALAEACEAANEYTFHDTYEGGYFDRDYMVKSAGTAGSMKRWEPMKQVREHAVARWQAEREHWKTAHRCAKGIEDDIVAYAESKGARMSVDNAFRTIYDWLRASEKHTD